MEKSSGILRYSPKLLGTASERWWLVLDCDPGIGMYYRHLFHMGTWRCQTVRRAAWEEHISVVRDEEPPDERKCFWERYSGDRLDFLYEPALYSDGLYCWLPVTCDRLLDIRVELGLPREPEIPLHLTIGNLR